jgi:O-antigen ligase
MPTKISPAVSSNSPRLGLSLDYLIFVFMALLLIVYGSFNILGISIVLIALMALIKNRHSLPPLSSDLRWLIYILVANFSLALFYFLIGRDSFEVLRDPLKLIFMIPMMLAFPLVGLRPERLAQGLALGMIGAACIVSYQQQVLGIPRPAILYNPNAFSEVAMVSCALLLSFVNLFAGWKKALIWLGALAGFYCVMLSQSRGTLLAVIPMALIAGFVFVKFSHPADSRKTVSPGKYLAAIVVILLLLGAGFKFQVLGGMGERIADAAENYSVYRADRTQFSSLSVRLELWYSTWLSFKEAPITGIGSDDRVEYLAKLESDGIIHLGSYPWRHAHSDYLDRLQRLGLPAMLLLIGLYGILVMIFWRGLKTDSHEQFSVALGGLLVVVGYATFSITEVPLYNSLTSIFFAVVISTLLGILRRTQLEHG